MVDLELVADFKPMGDQPEAIKQISESIDTGNDAVTLMGVTGSGKTFTVANVITELQRPTLILSHNKTLAAQLYSEFKQFFPNNAVEYYVSYYDYYQPEAFLPVTNTYIEKDLSINQEIEKLRLKATASLLSGRRDVIVISSVSCIYGIGNPETFKNSAITIAKGDIINRDAFLRKLVDGLYARNEIAFDRGNFRVKGDTIDVYLAYSDQAYRIILWDDEVEDIEMFDPITGNTLHVCDEAVIYPANLFVADQSKIWDAIRDIQDDLREETQDFMDQGRTLESKRLDERVNYDMEMLKELGHCSGIENYSRYFDGRPVGSRPFCLLDYFPDDYLLVIDESHVTVPQIRAMYGGDRSRKVNLVEHGFRLRAAMDNRPLKFEEFEELAGQTIFVSATPADYELEKSEGIIVEQVIRPTGVLDPHIEVRPSTNQIDNLIEEIQTRTRKDERVLVTTLTKRMAEELNTYFGRLGIRTAYIHSDIETIERVEIIENLRKGLFDVLIGVNLLREGLDMPEVSLVAILDADKEGFLRSTRSLTQTAGRAARNINGMVIMYADDITDSMQKTIDETNRRRIKQEAYNKENGLVPTPIKKSIGSVLYDNQNSEEAMEAANVVLDPVVSYMNKKNLSTTIENTRKEMMDAAKELDFMKAAKLRDEIAALEKIMEEKFSDSVEE